MGFELIGGLLGIGSRLVDRLFPDPEEAARAKARLLELEQQGQLEELRAAVETVAKELSGNSLQRNWRPVLMLSVVAILVNNYLIAPYLTLFGFPALTLDLPEKLWNLLTLGVSGYVVGRSGEKIAREWRK